MQEGPGHQWARRILPWALLLLVALGIRLAFNIYQSTQPSPGLTAIYDSAAKSLLESGGFPSWFVLYPPGYPLFLALTYGLFGYSHKIVRLIQILVFDLGSIILAFRLASQLFGRIEGWLAAWLVAIYPFVFYMSSWVFPESLVTFLLLLSTYLLYQAMSRRSLPGIAAAAIILGSALLVRADLQGLPLLIILLLLAAHGFSKEAFKQAAVILVVLLVIVAPWATRNYFVLDTFVPFSLGLGVNLWEGLADAGPWQGIVLSDDETSRREGYAANYWPYGVSRDRRKTIKSLLKIQENPLWYAKLMLLRAEVLFKGQHQTVILFNPKTIARESDPSFSRYNAMTGKGILSYAVNHPVGLLKRLFDNLVRNLVRLVRWSVNGAILYPFMLVGLFLALADWRKTWLVIIVPVYYVFAHVLVHADPRYIMPAFPFLLIVSATALISLAGIIRQRTLISRTKEVLLRSPPFLISAIAILVLLLTIRFVPAEKLMASQSLKVATGWSSQQITKNSVDDDDPAIARLPGGQTIIAYASLGAQSNRLMLAKKSEEGWQESTLVDELYYYSLRPSLAFTSSGSPAIAYDRLVQGDGGHKVHILYSEETEKGWTESDLSALGRRVITAWNADLLVRGETTHLAYQDEYSNTIFYARKASGQWSIEKVASGEYSRAPSIALTERGEVFIAFDSSDGHDQEILLARRTSNGWEKEVITRNQHDDIQANLVARHEELWLAVVACQVPDCFAAPQHREIRILRNRGQAWQTVFLTNTPEEESQPLLAIDEKNDLSIVFLRLQGIYGDLVYAEGGQNGATWRQSVAASNISSESSLGFVMLAPRQPSIVVSASDGVDLEIFKLDKKPIRRLLGKHVNERLEAPSSKDQARQSKRQVSDPQ